MEQAITRIILGLLVISSVNPVVAEESESSKKIVSIVFAETPAERPKMRKSAKHEGRYIKPKKLKDVSFGGPAAEIEIEPLKVTKKRSKFKATSSKANVGTSQKTQNRPRKLASIPEDNSKSLELDKGLEVYGKHFKK